MKMLNKQCMLIIVLWFFLPQSIAEELQNSPTAQDASVMKVPLSLLNPRVTMQTFSEAMQAIRHVDRLCWFLGNQKAIAMASYLRVSIIQQLFTSTLPMPIAENIAKYKIIKMRKKKYS